jgi:hypothetical protein
MEAVCPSETQKKLHSVKMQKSTISTTLTANTRNRNKVGGYKHFKGA